MAWIKQMNEELNRAIKHIVKIPTLTHGVLVKLSDVEKIIAEAEKHEVSQEPVGEIVEAFEGLVAIKIPVMPPVGTKLYTSPPQRQQEPVAIKVDDASTGTLYVKWLVDECLIPVGTKFYTSSPQPQPLTEDQVREIWRKVDEEQGGRTIYPFAKAIEAAHGIGEQT
jgi:hypothetical protein